MFNDPFRYKNLTSEEVKIVAALYLARREEEDKSREQSRNARSAASENSIAESNKPYVFPEDLAKDKQGKTPVNVQKLYLEDKYPRLSSQHIQRIIDLKLISKLESCIKDGMSLEQFVEDNL